VAIEGLAAVVQIDAGRERTYARDQAGVVFGWAPVVGRAAALENLPAAVEIAAGEDHACACNEAGDVWCWGANSFGQLGDGSTENSSEPLRVVGITSVSELALGHSHSCARTVQGEVWCWGDNRRGELADGTTARRLTPVQVQGLAAIAQISVGGDINNLYGHSCARSDAGQLWCWGDNHRGQLASGSSPWGGFAPAQVRFP
jgi:alpha-tubulin suppressor-like RCC1 family protein